MGASIKTFFQTLFSPDHPKMWALVVGLIIQTFNLIKFIFLVKWHPMDLSFFLLGYAIFVLCAIIPAQKNLIFNGLQFVLTGSFLILFLMDLGQVKINMSVFTFDPIFSVFLTQNNPITLCLTGIVMMGFHIAHHQFATNGAGTLLAAGTLLIFSFLWKRIRADRDRYRMVSITDELTQLYNFSFILQHGEMLLNQGNIRLRVLVMDLDNFKSINDSYGHMVGNYVLSYIAERIRTVLIGTSGVAGRFGGDEFVIILEESDQATSVKNQLMNEIERHPFRFNENATLPITLSIGEATISQSDHLSFEEMLQEADMNMYYKKQQRNPILINEDSIDSLLSRKSLQLLQVLREKDMYTYTHSMFVAQFAVQLAQVVKPDPFFIEAITIAGVLHDIGKIMLPNQILRKPEPLTQEEFKAVEQHVQDGIHLLRDLNLNATTLNAIRFHHERWDGRGYPFGAEREIQPLEGRILQIADAFSAMTNRRLYRNELSTEEALREIEKHAGAQFDPNLVAQFTALFQRERVLTVAE